jgi:hypothetical protein
MDAVIHGGVDWLPNARREGGPPLRCALLGLIDGRLVECCAECPGTRQVGRRRGVQQAECLGAEPQRLIERAATDTKMKTRDFGNVHDFRKHARKITWLR